MCFDIRKALIYVNYYNLIVSKISNKFTKLGYKQIHSSYLLLGRVKWQSTFSPNLQTLHLSRITDPMWKKWDILLFKNRQFYYACAIYTFTFWLHLPKPSTYNTIYVFTHWLHLSTWKFKVVNILPPNLPPCLSFNAGCLLFHVNENEPSWMYIKGIVLGDCV